MKSHRFTIIAAGMDHQADDFEDRFFAAGCDDATIAFMRGAIVLDFDREARNLMHAIASAKADVARAGAVVLRVEPDMLVSLSDIAERTGLTRAAVSLYARGERGRDFPLPVARIASESPLWNWLDVARWLHARGRLPAHAVVQARVVGWANAEIAKDAA